MNTSFDTTNHEKANAFIPAKPTGWFISLAQAFVRAQLALKNAVHISEPDLDILRNLPQDKGIILAANHADETDPRVCLEISRRLGKRFITMCNREAFDEMLGLAGLTLSHLGLFSVKRGAHDSQAKSFAANVVKQGKDVLVIFPEGEIFYLNEKTQPFHTGAVDICLESIIERQKENPNWTAYIVPMAIKYHYTKPIDDALERRIGKMEAELKITQRADTLAERLRTIRETLIIREERAFNLHLSGVSLTHQTQEIIATEDAILNAIHQKYPEMEMSEKASTIDRAWQLSAQLKESLIDPANIHNKKQLQYDIASLREVVELASWRPHYYLHNASPDRLAEGVIKLERELYGIHRPEQLSSRSVLIKISEPVNMSVHVSDYLADPHTVRHRLSEDLQRQIQLLIDQMSTHKR